MGNNEKVPQAPTGERLLPDDGNEKASEGATEEASEGATSGEARAPTAQDTPEQKGLPDDSTGSRGGSVLGSQSGRTGMGDGQPTGSSQGLEGAQGSRGGADRFPRR